MRLLCFSCAASRERAGDLPGSGGNTAPPKPRYPRSGPRSGRRPIFAHSNSYYIIFSEKSKGAEQNSCPVPPTFFLSETVRRSQGLQDGVCFDEILNTDFPNELFYFEFGRITRPFPRPRRTLRRYPSGDIPSLLSRTASDCPTRCC